MGIKVNRTGGMVVGASNIGGDIPPSGKITITQNGDDIDVSSYALADVNVPQPSGKITISQNGTDIDVSSYATADVDVAGNISVDEDYTVSEGTLSSASVELVGDVVAHIPDGVVTLDGGAFTNNAIINKVIMPNSVVIIEDGAPWLSGKGCFYGCNKLREIEMSSTLTKIGSFAFYYCKELASITIPDGVTTIGDSAFSLCTGLMSITIGDGVTSIGQSAFQECTALTSITIPDGVTTIGDSAFRRCTGLTSITIPNSVTSIGNYVFGDSGLTDIYYTGTQTQWEQILFGTDAIPQGVTVHYDYVPQ